jgi:hypothetical protein
MRRESLPIHEPCSADWERMDGDGVVRFCRLCNKDVHDVSAMTEDEAREFLAAGDQPCIRYRFDAQGDVLFQPRAGVGLLPRLAAAAALSFAGLAAGGCMGKPVCPLPETAKPTSAPPVQAEPADAPTPAPTEPASGPVEPAR